MNEITMLKDILDIDRLLGRAGKGEIAFRLVAVIWSSISSLVDLERSIAYDRSEPFWVSTNER